MKRDQLSILLEEEYFTEHKDERKNSTGNRQQIQRKGSAENRQQTRRQGSAESRQQIRRQGSAESRQQIRRQGSAENRQQTQRNSSVEYRKHDGTRTRRRKRRGRSLFHAFQYVFFFAVLAFTIFLAAKVRGLLTGSEGSDFSDFNLVDAFSSFSESSTGIAAGSMTGVTIVIDPGHGGDDPGCIVGSVQECDINLSVGLKVAELLEVSGAEVILTRTSDEYLALEDRAAVANDAEADYFISLHCNYYDDSSSISGMECYYYTGAADGGVLAEAILEYIERNTQIEVRKAQEQDLSVLRNTTMTAVLIEMGYMSNSQECSRLNTESYQNELAQAIAEGIFYAITEM